MVTVRTKLGVLGVLVLGGTSCGPEEAPTARSKVIEDTSGAESKMPRITPAEGFPAKVKNFNGRTALLESRPERVLAGDASLMEGLVELIGPERMAALPRTAMTYSVLREEPGPWADHPVLGSFEAEEVLNQAPDLVVVHAYQTGSTLDRLIERDVPVVLFPVATTWKETLVTLQGLGRLVDEVPRSTKLIADLERRRRELQSQSARSGLRVLPYGNYGSGGTTAGAGTTWQIMIELAGLRNAASEAGLDGHPEIDFEQLLALDPDFFLVALPEDQELGSSESMLRAEPLLANLRAVRKNRFLRLPEHLYSAASHHLLMAAERIAAQADAALGSTGE
jgi:iron complex transport system substrate-binding protein